MLRKQQLLALLLGACLACACFRQVVHADDDDYDDDDAEPAASGDDAEKDVVVLTDSNFDSTISKAKFALVEFYAPWCGHCKNLAPEWAKAATALKAYDASIVIGKVDATEEKDVAAKFEVSGYPTIKWFVNGEATEYSGGRTADDIIRWVKKKTGPPATTIEEVSKLKDLEGDNEVLVLGYFKAFEGADFDAFIAAAQVAEDVEYLQTTDSAVAEKAGLSKPGVVVIKNFAGEARETVVYSGKMNKKDVEEFVKGEKIPLVFPFSQQTSSKIFGAGIPKHILFVGKESQVDPESSDMKMLRKVASKYKGKLVFVSVNADDASGSPVIDFFGVDKEGKMPQVVGFYMEKRQKFKLDKKVDEKHVDEFAKAVFEDKATPIYKSAPIPKEPTDEDVTVVVGKNFDKIVKDSKKDVLLEIYAPWCGHCKSLAPIYSKLAKRFKSVDSVVIAKMDGTENEVPDLEVSGYPTIKFFPAGDDKAAVDYDGSRDLKGFTKFLKKNAKVPFELPKKKKSSATDEQKDDSHDEL